jgi:hypothetical protein
MKQFLQLLQLIQKRRSYIIVALLCIGVAISFTNKFLGKKSGAPASTTVTPSAAITTSPAALNLATVPTAAPTANTSLLVAPSPLTEARMQFADYDAAEKTVYYFDFDTNLLKSYNISTKQEQSLGELNAYVQTLRWAPNHRSILVSMENTQGNAVANPFYQESVEPGEILVGHYDIGQRKFTALNAKMSAFDFITNDKIIYRYNDTRNKNISIANPDGSNWKELTAFPLEATIIRSGATALVATDTGKVTRYDASGKKIESFELPANMALNGSAFIGEGRNGVVATSSSQEIVVTRLKPGAVEELVLVPAVDGDFQLLWDNKTNDVYLASYAGLAKIANSHP